MKRRKLSSIVLSLCMLLALMPQMVFAEATSGTTEDGLNYTIYDDGKVTITRYTGSATAITIPSEINSKPVTAIENDAFQGCTSLTNVTIPGSVISIGEGAFLGCTSLTSIAIPSGVITIGRNVFQDCTGLTSVTIPDNVTTIGECAFLGCTGLTSITIPSSVQTIENYVFNKCTGLISVTIPDSVTTIGEGAFYGCTSLGNITISNSVQTIRGSAFRDCTNLTRVMIPDSVTSIGGNVFDGCTSLASITVDEKNSAYSSEEDVLFSKDKKVLIRYPLGAAATSYSIPDGVTSIGYGAFNGARNLTSVTIPDSVTSIRIAAFLGCSSLKSVAIPDSVTSIEDSAFYGCTGLESIFLPDNESLNINSDEIPGTTSKVRYRLDNGKVTITEIALGEGKTSVAIPETIFGYPVVDVASDYQEFVGEHTHKGGTASSTAKALCSICGKEYGELLADNLEDIPVKPAADKSSDTGDSTSIAPWIALMLLAGAGITGAGFYSRRKRTNE